MSTIFQVDQVQFDDNALDIFGAKSSPDVIATPDSNVLKDNSLSKVLDQVGDQATQNKSDEPAVSTTATVDEKGTLNTLDQVVEQTATETAEETTEEKPEESTTGRPTTSKDLFIDYLTTKIEGGEFGITDDYDSKVPVADYLKKLSNKDLQSILDSNWKVKEDELRSSVPKEFYEALPDPVKDVAEYAAAGGNDWAGFFQAKNRVEQIKQYDPTNEDHHAPIVKTYLRETTQLTESQIDEQVQEWAEGGKLEKKAQDFKAPLDAIQKQRTDAYIQQAEQQRKKEEEIAMFYADNVYKALEDGQLAGVKLDKKLLTDLEHGLLGTAPGPWSGRPMNLLGSVIEQHQFIEPNYKAIAMMTWMGLDMEGCIKAIQQMGANNEVEKTTKLIKLAQGIGAQGQPMPQEQKPVKRLPNNRNVLKRQS